MESDINRYANLVVCDTGKACIYKQIKPPLVGEHAFPLTGFVCWSVHVTLAQQGTPIISIMNKKKSISMENSHFKENSPSIFHETDYKAHLSSLTSQFDKVLYIGLNIIIKGQVFRQKYTATAARFDE